jgi:peptidoglycan/xylan/chitin deacetylase (PgdA/CDA1 family)
MKFDIFLLLILFAQFANAKEVAITIDDFPLRCCFGNIKKLEEENNKFLETLKNFNVTIIAFVNEIHLHNKNKTKMIEMLEEYSKNGHEIGNHTYSHKIINTVGFEAFRKDIERGGEISQKIAEDHGMKLRYFRHPGLGNGSNKKQRKQLNDYLEVNGYIIAPVTIDTMDWRFNKYYLIAIARKDTKMMEKITNDYLSYIEKTIQFSENVTKEIFNRDVKHVLLMHAIQINIDNLDKVLQKIKDFGYKFINLNDALKDEIYKIDVTSNYGAGNSLSRWSNIFDKNEAMKGDPAPHIKKYY